MTNIREGSSLYYALLWTDACAYERFICALPLIAALDTTLDDVREPQVAEHKIHWWHEELERMLNRCARHPATLRYQDTLPAEPPNASDHPLIAGACLAILGSTATERFTPPSSESEANALQEQNFTGRLALLSHALSNNTDDLQLHSHSKAVALALAKHEQLIRLPYRLHRGHQVFSTETYARHQSEPRDLANAIRGFHTSTDTTASSSHTNGVDTGNQALPANVQSLLQEAIDHSCQAFDAALAEPTTTQRYRHSDLLPLWRLTVLRQQQLRLWNRKQPNLLRERSTLTPLRKFFIAWKNKH